MTMQYEAVTAAIRDPNQNPLAAAALARARTRLGENPFLLEEYDELLRHLTERVEELNRQVVFGRRQQ